MERILLVARNVFRGIFYRRILLLWVAAIVLLILQAAAPILINIGNPAIQNVIQRRALSGALGTWSTLCIALAIFMGASAIGGEISAKTLVTVFARPIRRWEFLVGKWIGVQSFALLSLLIGLLAGAAFAQYLGADVETEVLALSVGQTAAAVVLYSGIAVALGTLVSPGVAGALTILVVFLPSAVTLLSESDDSVYHAVGVTMDYVVPPGYTSHYSASIPAPIPAEAFRQGFGGGFGGRGGGGGGGRNRRAGIPGLPQAEAAEPEIDYDRETTSLLENVGYGALFLGLGCLVFSRRDLRLN